MGWQVCHLLVSVASWGATIHRLGTTGVSKYSLCFVALDVGGVACPRGEVNMMPSSFPEKWGPGQLGLCPAPSTGVAILWARRAFILFLKGGVYGKGRPRRSLEVGCCHQALLCPGGDSVCVNGVAVWVVSMQTPHSCKSSKCFLRECQCRNLAANVLTNRV